MHKKNSHKKKRKRTKNEGGSKGKESGESACESGAASCEGGGDGEGDGGKEVTAPCYEVKYSDVMGRFLVASRDIAAGEIIIEEPALVVGPCTGCDILCLGCYLRIDDDFHKCPGCGWPICDADCSGIGDQYGHSAAECTLFAERAHPDYSDLSVLRDSYQAIVPLRCLLLKSTNPQRWRLLSAMVSHDEVRRSLPAVWDTNERHVVRRLRDHWGLTQYTADEIHTVCGILEVNAFEIGPTGRSARALFDRAYLLAHACRPSTAHTDDAARRLTVRAARPHVAGDLLSLSYAYTLQGTLKRRDHLKQSKFFDCCCERCADPTELGTFAGALRCPRCTLGPVLSTDPLNQAAPWECRNPARDGDKCPGYRVPAVGVRMLLDKITDEYDQIDANDVPNYENFLHKYRNVLHPNHYLFLSVKHSLSQLYGKTTSYMIQDMPVAELNRKIEICRDIMKAFDVLEPGYSRLRGITLYELHAPLMILTTRDFEKRTISKDNLRIRLKEVVECLREAAKILGLEPKNSAEGLMASAAKDALKRIKDWEKIIGKI